MQKINQFDLCISKGAALPETLCSLSVLSPQTIFRETLQCHCKVTVTFQQTQVNTDRPSCSDETLLSLAVYPWHSVCVLGYVEPQSYEKILLQKHQYSCSPLFIHCTDITTDIYCTILQLT